MITRYGMTEEFGMVALETVNNAYLGGDASLACSERTAEHRRRIRSWKSSGRSTEKAKQMLRENTRQAGRDRPVSVRERDHHRRGVHAHPTPPKRFLTKHTM